MAQAEINPKIKKKIKRAHGCGADADAAQAEINEEVEKLKGKREEHKGGIQGLRGELRAHRDKIRAAEVAKGDMAEEVKAAAEERKKQEALTTSLAKELTSTDPAVLELKMSEVQSKLEAGNLGLKVEKELIKQMQVLMGDREAVTFVLKAVTFVCL